MTARRDARRWRRSVVGETVVAKRASERALSSTLSAEAGLQIATKRKKEFGAPPQSRH